MFSERGLKKLFMSVSRWFSFYRQTNTLNQKQISQRILSPLQGSPSGHAMEAAGVYTVITSLLPILREIASSKRVFMDIH